MASSSAGYENGLIEYRKLILRMKCAWFWPLISMGLPNTIIVQCNQRTLHAQKKNWFDDQHDYPKSTVNFNLVLVSHCSSKQSIMLWILLSFHNSSLSSTSISGQSALWVFAAESNREHSEMFLKRAFTWKWCFSRAYHEFVLNKKWILPNWQCIKDFLS